MRVFILFLILSAAQLVSARTQEKVSDVIEVARAAEIKVSVDIPPGWNNTGADGQGFMLSTAKKPWADQEYPEAPHPWAIILLPDSDQCDTDHSFKQPFSRLDRKPADVRESYACKQGVAIVAGYWDKDPLKEEHVREIYFILEHMKVGGK